MSRTSVYVEQISPRSTPEQVSEGIARLLHPFDLARMADGKTVLIKPNLSGESGPANTDPRVIYGVVRAFEQAGASALVGDGSIIGVDTMSVMREIGLIDALKGTRAEIVDLKTGRYVETRVRRGRCAKQVALAEAASAADLIVSVAKMKTHDATAVSLCMKNLSGLMHEYDMLHFHHVNVSECIVDLVATVKPALNIVDGLMAMDTFGAGPVEMGCVIAGTDPVAVDATASRAMGVDPAGIYAGTLAESHIKRAHERGLGEMKDIEVVGDLPSAQFAPPPASLNEISIPDGIEIIDGDPCPACIAMLATVLQKSQISNNKLGNTVILVGPNAPPPEKTKGRTIIIGNCLHRLQSTTQGSVFVIGCPPNATYDVLPVLEA
ncbi:MAG: DUF362 domain-containing protein [Armatimonadota bacterium]|nr:DUF362 domain-containing protein [Armatimonadota bacterium]